MELISNVYFKFKNYFVAKTSAFTNSKYAYPFIFLICFFESIIFPIPQEVFMIPMMSVNRAKIFTIATVAVFGSVIGGVIAYFIGFYLFDTVGVYILDLYELNMSFDRFLENIESYGFIYVFIGGFTLIPYKLITLSSGFLAINIIVFVTASILSRSIRFFIIAFIIYKFGPTLMREFEGKLTLYSLLIAVILILFSVLLINFI